MDIEYPEKDCVGEPVQGLSTYGGYICPNYTNEDNHCTKTSRSLDVMMNHASKEHKIGRKLFRMMGYEENYVTLQRKFDSRSLFLIDDSRENTIANLNIIVQNDKESIVLSDAKEADATSSESEAFELDGDTSDGDMSNNSSTSSDSDFDFDSLIEQPASSSPDEKPSISTLLNENRFYKRSCFDALCTEIKDSTPGLDAFADDIEAIENAKEQFFSTTLKTMLQYVTATPLNEAGANTEKKIIIVCTKLLQTSIVNLRSRPNPGLLMDIQRSDNTTGEDCASTMMGAKYFQAIGDKSVEAYAKVLSKFVLFCMRYTEDSSENAWKPSQITDHPLIQYDEWIDALQDLDLAGDDFTDIVNTLVGILFHQMDYSFTVDNSYSASLFHNFIFAMHLENCDGDEGVQFKKVHLLTQVISKMLFALKSVIYLYYLNNEGITAEDVLVTIRKSTNRFYGFFTLPHLFRTADSHGEEEKLLNSHITYGLMNGKSDYSVVIIDGQKLTLDCFRRGCIKLREDILNLGETCARNHYVTENYLQSYVYDANRNEVR